MHLQVCIRVRCVVCISVCLTFGGLQHRLGIAESVCRNWVSVFTWERLRSLPMAKSAELHGGGFTLAHVTDVLACKKSQNREAVSLSEGRDTCSVAEKHCTLHLDGSMNCRSEDCHPHTMWVRCNRCGRLCRLVPVFRYARRRSATIEGV